MYIHLSDKTWSMFWTEQTFVIILLRILHTIKPKKNQKNLNISPCATIYMRVFFIHSSLVTVLLLWIWILPQGH